MADVCPTCGATTKRIRSLEQHRRYFGVIRAALHYWPDTHEKQFEDEDDLRYWLQMKAGHREVRNRVSLKGLRRKDALFVAEAVIRGSKGYTVPVIHKKELVIFGPKSIAYANLGQAKFSELNNEIDALLQIEIGLTGEQLLNEYKARV